MRSAKPRVGRHSGKRLSWWRFLLAVVAVAVVAIGAVFLVRTAVAPVVAEADGSDATTPWFGGYMDVTLADDYQLPNSLDADTATTVLAFVVADPKNECEPTWGGVYDLDEASDNLDIDRNIARYRQAGGDVVVSFGGMANDELSTVCSDRSALADAYSSVVDRYDLDTVDLDIEGDDLLDTVAGALRADAIATVQAERAADGHDLAVWMTLPVSPDGLTDDGVRAVQQMLQAGVTLAGVNLMTMDYGVDLDGATMAAASESAIEGANAQLVRIYTDAEIKLPGGEAWSMLGATPMIGQNDIAGEVFTLKDAATLNAYAVKKGLGRMSMWSLNRDRTCGENYPNTMVVSNECSGVDQGGESFATALSAGFDGLPGPIPTATPTPITTAIVDDPESSPFPVWTPKQSYSAGVKVVRQGYVYVAKWWTDGESDPADPTVSAVDSPWLYVGPVLPTDQPFTLPTVAEGTYAPWDKETNYPAGERVVVKNVPFVAKWWTQGEDPMDAVTDQTQSAWELLDSDSVSR
ncbi:chitinase [Microbacterium halimionae]|uniref:Chitinase n=1 Tax=Microbacterium halimionae TaxID=1526413 RepID=A0A7W3PMF5_9MICO|nr:glycosyl hydrolase family 18 protein [Microbacterium halimionae]MBA8816869.1 chitinase [Microbacterium halimionae]NII94835.1 chitinase [Microbacterium halimionae]